MKKQKNYGGIAKCIEFANTKIEKHYRHIFKSDKYVMDMLNEFDLAKSMQWNETKMAYYSKNKGLYEFGTPISLLKYKPLTFIQKILFGISIIKIKLIKRYKKLENYTAEEWLKKNCGKQVYKKIWEPLLITKFGNKKNQISMVWLWGKINLRGSSSTAKGEKLGYLKGSFDILTKRLEEYLLKKDCKFKLKTSVINIKKKNDKYIVKTDKDEEEYDFIINTISYKDSLKILGELINGKERKKMEELDYTFAKTLLIYSKQSLTPYYWINIGDVEIPFGGIIEHTNMIDSSVYGGINVIYISNYMSKDDILYKMSPEELFEKYYNDIKKVNKNFQKEKVIGLQCFEEEYAQPIIATGYSEKILNFELETKGVFMANMAQIYPEDRGMNYAIKYGYQVAEKIINGIKN